MRKDLLNLQMGKRAEEEDNEKRCRRRRRDNEKETMKKKRKKSKKSSTNSCTSSSSTSSSSDKKKKEDKKKKNKNKKDALADKKAAAKRKKEEQAAKRAEAAEQKKEEKRQRDAAKAVHLMAAKVVSRLSGLVKTIEQITTQDGMTSVPKGMRNKLLASSNQVTEMLATAQAALTEQHPIPLPFTLDEVASKAKEAEADATSLQGLLQSLSR